MVSWFRRKKPAAPGPADATVAVPPAAPGLAGPDGLATTPGTDVVPDAVDPDLKEPEPAVPEAPAAPGRTGWRERLRGSGFARSIGGLFARNPKLDEDLLDEI